MSKNIKEGTRLKAAWRTAKEIGGPAAVITGVPAAAAALAGGGKGAAALAGGAAALGAAVAARKDVAPTYRRHKAEIADEIASGDTGYRGDFLNRSGLAGKAKTQKLVKKLGIEDKVKIKEEEEVMNEDEHYDRIIQATINNKPVEVKAAFDDAVFGKIADRIDALSVDIAQNTFASANTTSEPEEDEDDAFTDPEEFEDDSEWAEDEDDLSSVQDDEEDE